MPSSEPEKVQAEGNAMAETGVASRFCREVLEAGLRVGVTGHDLQGVQVRVELTGDAV